MLVIMAFSMLIGLEPPLISIKLGEGNRQEAEQIVATAVVMMVLISAAMSILGLTFLDPLLRLLGASDTVLPYAREYLSVIFFGTVFQTVSFGMNHFIRAEGNLRRAMSTMLIGAILNTILIPFLSLVLAGVRVPRWPLLSPKWCPVSGAVLFSGR